MAMPSARSAAPTHSASGYVDDAIATAVTEPAPGSAAVVAHMNRTPSRDGLFGRSNGHGDAVPTRTRVVGG